MRRLTLAITLLLTSGLVMVLPAAVHAQGSGLDEYQEGVPTPGGEAPGVPGGDGGGSSGGSAGTATEPTGVGGSGSSSAGAGTGSGSGSLTERQAGASGTTPAGQLPAPGFAETGAMALIGVLLLGGGLVLLRIGRRADKAATAAD
jgi:hypothetical protein